MTHEEIKTELAVINGILQNAKVATQKAVMILLKEAFKLEFENNPELESIGWTQYTPYFCDGDTCEFSPNLYELEGKHSSLFEIMNQIPDEVYKVAFGDHIQVIVRRDGAIRTVEYEHD